MSDLKQYRLLSLDFRRIASNMLRTDYSTSTVHFLRFKQYIDTQPIIHQIVNDKISKIEYDFTNCFQIDNNGWNEIAPPINESEHLKAIYDYMTHLISNNQEVVDVAVSYYHSGEKYNDIVRSFLEDSVKPLVDFIIDSLSKEIMILEEDKMGAGIVQNIEHNYGTANIANRDIHSVNTTTATDIAEICKLINNIRPFINSSDLDPEEKESLIDDLDVIEEQVTSERPKESRLKKAYGNFTNFISRAPDAIKAVTTFASNSQDLIEKVKTFME